MGNLLAIKISVDEFFALRWFLTKITPCEVVSFSLMVIGREDCRNVEAIAASSRGLGIKEVCVFDGVFFFSLFCSFLLYILTTLAVGDLKDHCGYMGEEQMCECLCNFHIFLSTVQFQDGSVRHTKNTKVHLKKFIHILSLTLQHFLFPNTIKNYLIFYTISL